MHDQGLLSEARQQYETALRLQPDYAAVYLNIGALNEELGALPEGASGNLEDLIMLALRNLAPE